MNWNNQGVMIGTFIIGRYFTVVFQICLYIQVINKKTKSLTTKSYLWKTYLVNIDLRFHRQLIQKFSARIFFHPCKLKSRRPVSSIAWKSFPISYQKKIAMLMPAILLLQLIRIGKHKKSIRTGGKKLTQEISKTKKFNLWYRGKHNWKYTTWSIKYRKTALWYVRHFWVIQ